MDELLSCGWHATVHAGQEDKTLWLPACRSQPHRAAGLEEGMPTLQTSRQTGCTRTAAGWLQDLSMSMLLSSAANAPSRQVGTGTTV